MAGTAKMLGVGKANRRIVRALYCMASHACTQAFLAGITFGPVAVVDTDIASMFQDFHMIGSHKNRIAGAGVTISLGYHWTCLSCASLIFPTAK